ncbi:BURP domain-containing protein 10-like isoform X2 [Oryza brachyantha]|uniref:BURP domain-containing protein 10-like isoform X2 n=1 Tax=Oryza brachyantha TaxID=4533 RepID=UPI001ADA9B47|nr:BURP domain-containing protein 10-like isoform X2 [Oryza brachyantha]
MSALLSLLSFLLLMMTGEGRNLLSAETGVVTLPGPIADVAAYWKTMLPNSPIPSAILDLLTPPSEDGYQYGHKKDSYNYSSKEAGYNYGKKKDGYQYGKKEDGYNYSNKEAGYNYGKKENGYQYGKKEDGYNYGNKDAGYNYGKKEDGYQYGKKEDGYNYGNKDAGYNYGKKEDGYQYGKKEDGYNYDNKDAGYNYGKKEDGYQYGKKEDGYNYDNKEAGYNYGKKEDGYQYGKKEDGYNYGNKEAGYNYGKKEDVYQYSNKEDGYKYDNKDAGYNYGKKEDGYNYGNQKLRHDHVYLDKKKLSSYNYDKQEEGYNYGHPIHGHGHVHLAKKKMSSYNYGSSTGGHDHIHHDGHNHMVFGEELLTPGSTFTPYIMPASARGPFLRRDVAESVPMSTKNFTDILKLFAPVSSAMAGGIWGTLAMCERPGYPVRGERRACARSVESLVELAMSVLGTRDLRAFSSSEVPEEGIDGTTTGMPRRRYSVVSVKTVTSSQESMTCHGVKFAHAVFYCHAINPTRSYEVTLLQQEEGDGDENREVLIRALAVCHLDTSEFDPKKMPANLRPGEGAACHFISRDSIIWAPADHASAQQQATAAEQ